MKFRFPAFRTEHRYAVFVVFWTVACSMIAASAYMGFREPRVLAWSAVDRYLAFSGWFIYPYFSHYVFMVTSFFLLKDVRNMNRVLFAMGLATMVGVAVYFIYPIKLPSPYYFDPVYPRCLFFRYLNDIATPFPNCLPSLHVAFALIAAMAFRHEQRFLFPLAMAWALLIAASTVYIKQHYFIDIPTGMALAGACYWVAYTRVDFIFARRR